MKNSPESYTAELPPQIEQPPVPKELVPVPVVEHAPVHHSENESTPHDVTSSVEAFATAEQPTIDSVVDVLKESAEQGSLASRLISFIQKLGIPKAIGRSALAGLLSLMTPAQAATLASLGGGERAVTTTVEMSVSSEEGLETEKRLQEILNASEQKPLPESDMRGPTFEVFTGTTMTPENQKRLLAVLSRLPEDGQELEVSALPRGGNVEESTLAGLNITAEKMQAIGFHPILINGEIQAIALETGEYVLPEGCVEDDQMHLTEGVDSFGNLILYGRQDGEEGLVVTPRPVLSRDILTEGQEAQFVPIPIEIEGEHIEDLFYTQVQHPYACLGENKEYCVYGDMPREEFDENFVPKLEKIEMGAESAEALFGLKKGEGVRNIQISDGTYQQALFNDRTPNSIIFFDELMKGDVNLKMTAFHESMHLMDDLFKISEVGELKDFFEELDEKNPKFFYSVNESRFFRAKDAGGHAEDNEHEFFASFMNSLISPDFEDHIQDRTKMVVGGEVVEDTVNAGNRRVFFETYLQTTEHLSARLKTIDAIPKEAPIWELLERRGAFLEALLALQK